MNDEKTENFIASIIAVLLLIGFAWFSYSKIESCRNEILEREKQYQALSKIFAPYLNYYADPLGFASAVTTSPYIKGKVLVVDCQPRTELPGLKQALGKEAWVEVNRLEFLSLPEEMRAKTTTEVGTVVQLRWNQLQVGSYKLQNGTIVPGCKIICIVVIIDLAKKSVVGVKAITGDDPKSSIKSYESPYGMRPETEIVDCILSLPRR